MSSLNEVASQLIPEVLDSIGCSVLETFLRLRLVDSPVLVLASFLRALYGPTSLRSTPRI